MYVDAKTTVNCVFAAKIRGTIKEENLRIALLEIQRKHPLLRVVIREDEQGRPYFVSNTKISQIPLRIEERFSDNDWITVSEAEWENRFDVKRGPLARVVWLRSANVSEILLVCAHCICDGTSILTLMREILQVLDQQDIDMEPYESFESVNSLIPSYILSNRKMKMKAWLIAKIAGWVLSFKTTKHKSPPDKSYLLNWKMDEESSTALINLCKQEKTALHAAFSVAFLEAMRELKGDKAKGQVIYPVDIRRYISEIKNDHLFAFAPIEELPVDKDSNTDFWTKTRKLRNDLAGRIDVMNIHELLLISEYFHSSVKKLIAYLKSSEGTHDVTLSNMGRLNIPDSYQSFHLETIHSPSASFPWRNPNTLIITNFRREIDFSFISSESFLSKEDATIIKDRMMELLVEKIAVLQQAL
ncbi:Condensation domain-containing protein [Chitinophaga sp. CF118]|nr:Condensation domain-containing protein [Chitinophaga sp. CF118]